MKTEFTFTIDIADIIPIVTGTMVFIAVLLSSAKSLQRRRLGWYLGGSAQILLITFGVLTQHYGFSSHMLVAIAFVVVLWRTSRFNKPKPIEFHSGGIVQGPIRGPATTELVE